MYMCVCVCVFARQVCTKHSFTIWLCKLLQTPTHSKFDMRVLMQTLMLHTDSCTYSLPLPPSLSLSLSLSETVSNYKQTVQSAFLEVQDILGDLGLGDDDGGLHGNNQSVQEVKVSYQGDGNSLESPPDSEKDPFEVLDSLLDFGLDDDMTISKGSGGDRTSTGADLVKSTIEVQRALKVRKI